MSDRKLLGLTLAAAVAFAAFAGGATSAFLSDTERIAVTIAASGNTNAAEGVSVQDQPGGDGGGVAVVAAGNVPAADAPGPGSAGNAGPPATPPAGPPAETPGPPDGPSATPEAPPGSRTVED